MQWSTQQWCDVNVDGGDGVEKREKRVKKLEFATQHTTTHKINTNMIPKTKPLHSEPLLRLMGLPLGLVGGVKSKAKRGTYHQMLACHLEEIDHRRDARWQKCVLKNVLYDRVPLFQNNSIRVCVSVIQH